MRVHVENMVAEFRGRDFDEFTCATIHRMICSRVLTVSRATVNWHLRQMVAEGLLTVTDQGKGSRATYYKEVKKDT